MLEIIFMKLNHNLKNDSLKDRTYNPRSTYNLGTKERVNQLNQSKHLDIIEKLMMIVGIVGQTLFYFQAYKIYTTASAKDVSVTGFSFALFSLICWLLYGFVIKNKVLIIVNTFAVIGAALTLLSIFIVS